MTQPTANQNPPEQYAKAIRFLHWLMALGFLFMWVSGYTMTSLVQDDSAIEEILFGLHISTGVTLLGLLLLRLMVRITTVAPPLPDGLAPWERIGSRLGHGVRWFGGGDAKDLPHHGYPLGTQAGNGNRAGAYVGGLYRSMITTCCPEWV
ncbi:hypothetical protein MACH17_41410 [Phaeobacter inhibens]|uniref:cytochrome b n=1 Tax=Phaeobacter inhibens TaxID=221822 RepID=UPI00274AA509|nr:cytochrome b/b6 domain-containing protein [Phaeobacter inhibens]GLO72624.1 hypothetical protein MACH17_41410 [Phaeobacter inhibens]